MAPPLSTAPPGLLSASHTDRDKDRTVGRASPIPTLRPLVQGGQEPPGIRESKSAAPPATCAAAPSRVRPCPPEKPTLAGCWGCLGFGAPRGGPRADPRPPGGGREQLARHLPASFPSPDPPATHGFSLGGGRGARRRRAGRRGGGAARRCGGPAWPPGPRARRRCPPRSATGRRAAPAGRPGRAS